MGIKDDKDRLYLHRYTTSQLQQQNMLALRAAKLQTHARTRSFGASSHEIGAVVVDDGAEREAVPKRSRHVGHLEIVVASRGALAPF